MSLVDTITTITKPWADFYSHSKPVSAAVTWVHLSGILVGGGTALASDRTAFRLAGMDIDDRRRLLHAFSTVHRTVVTALVVVAISGVAMLLADTGTFLVSPIYWTKMGLVVLLLFNGWNIMRTEQRLTADPAPANPLWRRFTIGAVASITLWLTTLLAGVILMNA